MARRIKWTFPLFSGLIDWYVCPQLPSTFNSLDGLLDKSVMRLTVFFTSGALVAHFMACIFYWVATIGNDPLDPYPGWTAILEEEEMVSSAPFTIMHRLCRTSQAPCGVEGLYLRDQTCRPQLTAPKVTVILMPFLKPCKPYLLITDPVLAYPPFCLHA